MSDTGDESAESTQQTCPVCGQEYVHKRQGDIRMNYTLRSDFTQCIAEPEHAVQIAYVHNTQRIAVSRLERSSSGHTTFADKLDQFVGGKNNE